MEPNIQNRRSPISWVPTLYFAMGMPFVVLNMVCTLMFKGLDVSDAQIAFWTSIIMFPWTLKPLWSPLLEIYKTKKLFVIFTQIATGCIFGLVALALHLPNFFAVCIALLAIIAFSGALMTWLPTAFIWLRSRRTTRHDTSDGRVLSTILPRLQLLADWSILPVCSSRLTLATLPD